MRTASYLVLVGLFATGCTVASTEDRGATESAYAEESSLRPSTDPNEQRLAAVESVIGLGLKAVAVWQRDTEYNGRDLWITIRGFDGTARAWQARENILSVESIQFLPGSSRIIGKEHTRRSADNENDMVPLEFWLDASIDTSGGGIGPVLDLTKRSLSLLEPSSYTVEARDDSFAKLLERIEQMDKIESAEHMARLFTLAGHNRNENHVVLVLTDRESHQVFPLDVRASRTRHFGFVGPREVAFEAVQVATDGQESTSRFSVSWDEIGAPKIRPLP